MPYHDPDPACDCWNCKKDRSKPTRCCICRDAHMEGDQELKDLMYVEPRGEGYKGLNPVEPVYIRGWMCEDCAIVHWAWDPRRDLTNP